MTDLLEQPKYPEINVLAVSLVIFFSYVLFTAGAALALTASSGALHPATRLFFWLVVCTAIGYRLLRRHGRYPKASRLGLVLAINVFFMFALSLPLVLRRDELALGTYLIDSAANSLALIAVGGAGFWAALQIYRWRRDRR